MHEMVSCAIFISLLLNLFLLWNQMYLRQSPEENEINFYFCNLYSETHALRLSWGLSKIWWIIYYYIDIASCFMLEQYLLILSDLFEIYTKKLWFSRNCSKPFLSTSIKMITKREPRRKLNKENHVIQYAIR